VVRTEALRAELVEERVGHLNPDAGSQRVERLFTATTLSHCSSLVAGAWLGMKTMKTQFPQGAMKLVGLPVKLSETPGNPLGHAPELGEHTEAILTGMRGYSLGTRGAA
jgi:crotonobetainyl-CoA:carnitine CoA-transferase CaiB-like acyl-CoA transferase